MDRRKLRLFLLLPLESGCWGGRLLCHQKHLGSYANVQICFHFSPLSSPTYLLTAHFCLCGCYLTHFSFSFTHHFLALQSFFFFVFPTLEMETRRRKLGLERNSVPGETWSSCSLWSLPEPVLCPGDVLPISEEPMVTGEGLSCYWIWGSDKKNWLPKSRTASGLCQNASTQTSSLHLLCGGSSTFTFRFPAFSLSPLRLKHLLSGWALGRRHDALTAAWLAHFQADLSSTSEPDL